MRLLLVWCCAAVSAGAAPAFHPSATSIDVFDFVEVTLTTAPAAGNPFLSTKFHGELRRENDAPVSVDGFCDSPDGSLYRIRFMALAPGHYTYNIRFESSAEPGSYQGSFTAKNAGRRGLVRIDPAYPNHFLWQGTGEHYFWNGLTTYALMGWQDESYIHAIIDRAARLKVNRLRVTLNGPRVADASRWYEPVVPSPQFQFLFGPWVGSHPQQVRDPGWDIERFNVDFWQKYERMVHYARDHDVVISVIFFLDGEDPGADPFGKARAFGEDEKRYYAYAAARLSAYSNVMWDITNEWHLFRTAWWVERMGSYLTSIDPYHHLTSSHGRGDFPWMLSPWADFAMFQLWDEEGGYQPMLKRHQAQAETGRPMPQINEEYGYEDHYPVKWGGNRRSPARSADNRRRQAWQIAMAGCYQTTGERANRGDGNPPATPGGWINGGFDSSMTMLEGYAHLVDFFHAFEYWKLDPAPELNANGVLTLAEPGRQYVLYLPSGGAATVALPSGDYGARWFNPRTGVWSDTRSVHIEDSAPRWTTPPAADSGDWAILLQKK